MSNDSTFPSTRPASGMIDAVGEISAVDERVTEIVCRVLRANTGRSLVPGPDDRLIENGTLDSLSVADLAVALRTGLGVPLELGDLREETFGSIRAISALLAALLAEQGTAQGAAQDTPQGTTP